jgi:hypothetical protein
MLNLPGFDLANYCHAPSRRNRCRGALAELDMLWRRYKVRIHWSGHVISYHALETQA